MLDKQQIQEIIPHRPPFLLVDRIEHLDVGKRAVGYKEIATDEWFFNGHFPGNPVMPGILIVEALAQVGCVAVLSLPQFKQKTALFGSIQAAKFKKIVLPGDVLRLETTLLKLKKSAGLGRGVASVNDVLACECEFLFMIQPRISE